MQLEIEDDGFIDVQLGESKVRIDLYAVYNQLIAIRDRHAGEADASPLNAATVDYMASLGFPRVSHKAGIAFTNGVKRAVEELEKKVPSPGSPEPTPGSPDTSAPPS